jgi:hypothetical protein
VLPRTTFDENLQKVMEKHKEKLKEDLTSSFDISLDDKPNESPLYLTPPSIPGFSNKKSSKSTKKGSDVSEEKETSSLDISEPSESTLSLNTQETSTYVLL